MLPEQTGGRDAKSREAWGPTCSAGVVQLWIVDLLRRQAVHSRVPLLNIGAIVPELSTDCG